MAKECKDVEALKCKINGAVESFLQSLRNNALLLTFLEGLESIQKHMRGIK